MEKPIAWWVREDAQQAFREAIAQGRLSERTAGDYMYMGTTAKGDDFKHRDTRIYLKREA